MIIIIFIGIILLFTIIFKFIDYLDYKKPITKENNWEDTYPQYYKRKYKFKNKEL
tara:strand:+ start:2513 stop:2677 length:165 start_codon:yes stop_codon:yes gene_type:complete